MDAVYVPHSLRGPSIYSRRAGGSRHCGWRRRVADLALCGPPAASAAAAHSSLPAGDRRVQDVRYYPDPHGRGSREPDNHGEHLRVQDSLSHGSPGTSECGGGDPVVAAIDPHEPGDPPHSQEHAMIGARRKLLTTGGAWALAAACGVLFSFPVLNTVLTSLKTVADISSTPPKWVFAPTVEHYANVFYAAGYKLSHFLANSLLISLACCALFWVVCMPACYRIWS